LNKAEVGPCPSAQWSFSGDAEDTSIYGNNATTTASASLTSDRFGVSDSAYEFNGNGSFILIPHSSSTGVTGNQITMAAWVKPSATIGAHNILSKRNGSNTGGYILHNTATNKLMAYVYTTSWQSVVSSDVVYSIGQWVHVAAVYDGSTFKAYANGVEVGTRSLTGAINDINTPLTIGGNGGVQSWPGSIDDVRIYNRALTPNEVMQLAQANV
jgi:hypothetical protein